MLTTHEFRPLNYPDVEALSLPEPVRREVALLLSRKPQARVSSQGNLILRNSDGAQAPVAVKQLTRGTVTPEEIHRAVSRIHEVFPPQRRNLAPKPSSPDVKFCTSCAREKSREEFHKKERSADGLQTYCIDCSAQMHNDNRARVRSGKAVVKKRVDAKKAAAPTTLAERPKPSTALAEANGWSSTDAKKATSSAVITPTPTATMPTLEVEPSTSWERVQQMIAPELATQVRQLEQENAMLRQSLVQISEALGTVGHLLEGH